MSTHRRWAFVLLGVLIGFGLGAGIHLLVNPLMEDTFARDLQGLVWNVVPGLTVLGGITGWWVGERRG